MSLTQQEFAPSSSADTQRSDRARRMAIRAAELTQGTCSLEGQGLSQVCFDEIVESMYRQLMATPRKW